jgi:uncharacterized HAD superfamily protein
MEHKLRDKLIAVDLDGTLCEGRFWEEEPKPIQHVIDAVNEAYIHGAHVVIYTARADEHFRITRAWLRKYGVKYHGINMGDKPGADYYVDDKAITPSEFIKLLLPKE